MSDLGNSSSIADFYQISGTFNQFNGGLQTVPSPGILVTELHTYAQANGSASAARLYVWDHYGTNWLIRSGTFSLGTGAGWVNRTDLSPASGSDLYIPSGKAVDIGIYIASADYTIYGGSSGSSYYGNGGDGAFAYQGTAGSGFGDAATYLVYTPLPAPTLTAVSPSVAPAGSVVTLTGTALLHTSGITVCGVNAPTYTINSDTSITLTIPSGATGAGTIVVTNPAGSANIAFVAGQVYADNGSAWAAGVTLAADDGTTWHTTGVQMWVDDGTTWHQIA